MAGLRGHVMMYSPDQATQWTHSIVGGGVTITDGLAITPDGDYLAPTRAAMGIPTLRKLTQLWTRMHAQEGGHDHAYEVVPAPDGSIYVAGQVTANGSTRAWLRKYDPAGEVVWTQFDPTSQIAEWQASRSAPTTRSSPSAPRQLQPRRR